jgi:hypothetical protein
MATGLPIGSVRIRCIERLAVLRSERLDDPCGSLIASNCAEGAGGDSIKEFILFLHIGRGSAAELRTPSYIANRIGMIDKPT